MAFSNLSIMLTPVLFGFVSNKAGVSAFPVFLIVMFVFLLGCTAALKIGDAGKQKRIV